jgi:hypothetical protein
MSKKLIYMSSNNWDANGYMNGLEFFIISHDCVHPFAMRSGYKLQREKGVQTTYVYLDFMVLLGMHLCLDLKVDVIIEHNDTMDTYIWMACDQGVDLEIGTKKDMCSKKLRLQRGQNMLIISRLNCQHGWEDASWPLNEHVRDLSLLIMIKIFTLALETMRKMAMCTIWNC